jgi:type I restriction enzyme, S subunit
LIVVTPRKGYKSVPWLFGKEIEIPSEWKVETFDDMFEFIISGTNARSDLNDSGEIMYIHYGDIHTKWNLQLDCDLDTIPRIDKEKVSRLQLLKEGDLIIADASEDVEGSGTSISLKNVKNKKIVAGLHTLALRRKNKNITFDFMKYLTSISFVKIQIISWVTGAKVFGLSKTNSKKIKVPLPSCTEQQKITSILSNVDDLIESTEKVIEKCKIVKKGLLQKLLTQGIGHTKFKKVPWFFGKEIEIPEEWNVLHLDEICNIRESNSVNSNTYIGLEHISQNDNKLIGQATTEEFTSRTNLFHIDDVLYGKLRPLLNKVWLATKEGHCSTDILPLQTKNNVIPTILLLILTEYRFFWFAVSTSSGTKMPRTNWTDMKKFPVCLPPLTEQQKIVSIFSNINDRITSQEQYREKLQKLKKSLIQKLLTGEVRVKV